MEQAAQVSNLPDIATPLLVWFRKVARDLPWRRTYDPYHVWISEIMLQQTQMERGVAYFKRWVERFPDVHSVAKAEQQEIFKYWEGLGYYARARNLQKAAQVITSEFDGLVPDDYQILLSLPGIGPYTAAAIASIAGNHDVAVVDANVTRVYARLFDYDQPVGESGSKKHLASLAQELLPHGRARMFNQALMDLGGLICLPKKPRCSDCPVHLLCKARMAGTIDRRPAIGAGKKMVAMARVAGIIRWEGRVFIQQRPIDAVWGGLWEFPGGALSSGSPEAQLAGHILLETGLAVRVLEPVTTVSHSYTHHKITLDCFLCEALSDHPQPVLRSAVDYRWLDLAELQQYAFPAGPRKILQYITKHLPDLFNPS
ncbi:MAG: A/G-specific adenine glycosylase [Desulforhopalus sp.]|nr:A/G-specific adenine glycosylase [Desulforhopalus sp.]